MATSQFRNFACVVYPESAPEDWLSILSDMCIPCFISPLHDKDSNPTGEPKKAHYHVLLCFEGKKSIKQVEEIFEAIGGVYGPKDIIVNSLRGYARYLCHLDNPEKYQYCTEDVQAFGGADYPNVIGLPTDKYKVIGEMIDFCEDNCIVSYAQLLMWSRQNRFEWFRVLCDSGTYVIKEYLKSKSWECSQNEMIDINNRHFEEK